MFLNINASIMDFSTLHLPAACLQNINSLLWTLFPVTRWGWLLHCHSDNSGPNPHSWSISPQRPCGCPDGHLRSQDTKGTLKVSGSAPGEGWWKPRQNQVHSGGSENSLTKGGISMCISMLIGILENWKQELYPIIVHGIGSSFGCIWPFKMLQFFYKFMAEVFGEHWKSVDSLCCE